MLTSLPNTMAVRPVALGPMGIAEEVKGGLLVDDTTTLRPEDSMSLGSNTARRRPPGPAK